MNLLQSFITLHPHQNLEQPQSGNGFLSNSRITPDFHNCLQTREGIRGQVVHVYI